MTVMKVFLLVLILSSGKAPKNNQMFDNGDYAVIFAFSTYQKSNLVGFNVMMF